MFESDGRRDDTTFFFTFFFSVSQSTGANRCLHQKATTKSTARSAPNPAILGAISREFVTEPREREISRVAWEHASSLPRARLTQPAP